MFETPYKLYIRLFSPVGHAEILDSILKETNKLLGFKFEKKMHITYDYYYYPQKAQNNWTYLKNSLTHGRSYFFLVQQPVCIK